MNSDRFFESLLTGVPMHPGIRTPDGRVLLEIHQQGQADAKRHGEMVAIQGELVRTLRDANRGSPTVTRDDFRARREDVLPAFREAVGRIQELNRTQSDLLGESRVLNQIASEGFSVLGGEMAGVRHEVRGVRSDLAGIGASITGAVNDSARMQQGPAFPAESLTNIASRGQLFFDALSAYSKGILTPQARREVENLVNERLRSPTARASVRTFIEGKVEETVEKMRRDRPDDYDEQGWRELKRTMRRDATEVTSIIDNPSELVGENNAAALDKLRTLQKLSRVCPDEALSEFVRNAVSMCSLARKASGAPVSQEFLVDLTNSGLVTDAVQHSVKRSHRGARLAGTAVDRNYNLMELLDQGDYAKTQRGRLVELAERHLAVDEVGVRQRNVVIGQGFHAAGQRDVIIEQGVSAAGQRDEQINLARQAVFVGVRGVVHLASIDESLKKRDVHLERVVDNLTKANDHLINLERLGEGFIDAVNDGFEQVNDTLIGGFNMVAEGLDQVASEIAISRAAIVSHLRQIDDTIRVVGANIVNEVAYGNQQLERLVALQVDSQRNLAQQRLRQGLELLKSAKNAKDFGKAADVFKKGIEDDPTLVENQFGLGVASEGMDDTVGAREWYRDAGRLAPKEKGDLAVTAWVKYAKLEEAAGNFPLAIEGMRSALGRDPKNPELRFKLARLLALSGQEEEAEEIVLQLIDENTQFLFKLKLDPAFSPDLSLRVYTTVWEQGGPTKKGLKVILFLLEEFASLGEKEMAILIFKRLMTGGPRLVLQYRIFDSTSFPATVAVVSEYIQTIIVGSADPYSAEDWYAMTFIASRVNLNAQNVLQCFQRGLKHDMSYQRGDSNSVLVALGKIDKEHLHELVESICSVDTNFNWLRKPQ